MSILQAIRIFLFYLLLGTSSLLWCSLSFFIAPFLPFKALSFYQRVLVSMRPVVEQGVPGHPL
jgi:hypothetical protein